MTRPTVVIVGGGITGLSAAWALAKPVDGPRVVVLEASDRLGGKLRTSTFAGLAVDEGADAFLARVPEATALCRELGLGDELVAPATARAYLWWDHELHQLPPGLVLGVPADLTHLARSRLLSPRGKARAALEPLLPGLGAAIATDNLGTLIRRRFGDEVLERLVDPLVGGINAGDADHLSAAAAAPQVAAVAGRARSLLIGLRRQAAATARRTAADGGTAAPIFLAPRGGMTSVVARLTGALGALGVDLRTGTAVDRIAAIGDQGRWRVADVDADAVIVATPAFVAANQLVAIAPTAAAMIGTIEHATVAVVTLAFAERDVGRRLDGSGYLVPKPQQRALTACSWSSSKWAHANIPGQVVLRASLGRYGNEGGARGTDDELVERALTELREPMRLTGRPTEARVTRWERGFPQHQPGHLDLVARIDDRLGREAPGVVVAGAAYRGVGIPACIRQGTAAAEAVIGRLHGRSWPQSDRG